MRRAKDLDAKDREILSLLEEDARRTNADIAKHTGLSAPTVAERIARLRDIGVITGFTVDIDPGKVGLPIAALVRFQPTAREADAIAAVVSLPAVKTCHRVTGSSMLELTIRVSDSDELKAVLDQLRRMGDTETSLILATDFERRAYFASQR